MHIHGICSKHPTPQCIRPSTNAPTKFSRNHLLFLMTNRTPTTNPIP